MFENDGDYIWTFLIGFMVMIIAIIFMNLTMNPPTPLSKAISSCTNHQLTDRRHCLDIVEKHFGKKEQNPEDVDEFYLDKEGRECFCYE